MGGGGAVRPCLSFCSLRTSTRKNPEFTSGGPWWVVDKMIIEQPSFQEISPVLI